MAVRSIGRLADLKSLTAAAGLTVVDCFAQWCGPCKMVAPHIERLATQKPNVTFVKVDVDEAGDIASHLQISAMPTFVFFKGGREIERIQGADINRVQSLVAQHETVPRPTIPDDAGLAAMKPKELLTLMAQLSISSSGLPEKQDLIDEIKKHR